MKLALDIPCGVPAAVARPVSVTFPHFALLLIAAHSSRLFEFRGMLRRVVGLDNMVETRSRMFYWPSSQSSDLPKLNTVRRMRAIPGALLNTWKAS